MRNANNENTSKGNLKDSALSVPVFCAFFFEKKGYRKQKVQRKNSSWGTENYKQRTF